MRRASVICVVVIMLLLVSPVVFGDEPGKARWPIKTSVSADARLDNPKATQYADLPKLDDPPGVTKNDRRYRDALIPQFPNAHSLKEGDIILVTGWLHLVAAEPDGAHDVQISSSADSQAQCIVVEVPKDDAQYVTSGTVRQRAQTVRAFVRD
jgi:hypothetical protein